MLKSIWNHCFLPQLQIRGYCQLPVKVEPAATKKRASLFFWLIFRRCTSYSLQVSLLVFWPEGMDRLPGRPLG